MSISPRVVLVDAGPLFALIDSRDQYHHRAHQELDDIYDGGWGFAVAWTTVAETYSLLARRIGVLTAQEWLEDLIRDFMVLPVSPDDYLTAIEHLRRFPDQQFSLFDAIVYVLSRERGMPVWSFDHHFDVMSAQRWWPTE